LLAFRDYQLTCTPTHGQVNDAYTMYPVWIAIATFGFFVMQLPLLALAASWGDLKKAVQRSDELSNANQVKNLALARLAIARQEAELATTSKSDFMAFLCHELRNPL
jgi:signal transduction histidine kinase